MHDDVVPDFDPWDRNHKYIWDCLSYKLTNEDFEAIERILEERREDHEAVDKTKKMFIPFGEHMMQPRDVTEVVVDQAHRYIDWSAGQDIWMILSKYAKFYSN